VVQSVRIHVFGGSGAGTTTLGRALAERFHVRYLDNDDYFWQPTEPPFTTHRPRDERIALLSQELAQADSWVLSGSMCGWGEVFLKDCTLAVFLRVPPEIRMQRIAARERQRYGARIEPGGDMYEQSRTFVEWARRYDTAGVEQRSRTLHEEWMKAVQCRWLRIENDAAVAEWVDEVVDELERR
jgi:adenylate kinase family enzyme